MNSLGQICLSVTILTANGGLGSSLKKFDISGWIVQNGSGIRGLHPLTLSSTDT